MVPFPSHLDWSVSRDFPSQIYYWSPCFLNLALDLFPCFCGSCSLKKDAWAFNLQSLECSKCLSGLYCYGTVLLWPPKALFLLASKWSYHSRCLIVLMLVYIGFHGGPLSFHLYWIGFLAWSPLFFTSPSQRRVADEYHAWYFLFTSCPVPLCAENIVGLPGPSDKSLERHSISCP